MDATTLALVAGSGWAAGLHLYGAALVLGLLGRFAGIEAVPAVLTRTDVLVLVAVLVLVEEVADKVPWLDSFWDLVHTAVRPAGAAALALLLTGEAETTQQALAALGSSGLALSAHTAKATTRLAVNASPEPVSNVGLSVLEDGLVVTVLWLAVTNPVLALALVAVLVVAGSVVTVLLVRTARRALRTRRDRRAARRAAARPAHRPPDGRTSEERPMD
ncbi:MAG: DUF4126 domain-containing protein [Nitriliruptoraceae bacterium]